MAKKRRKGTPKAIIKPEEPKVTRGKKTPGLIRWGESYTSLLLGIIVVIIGVLFFASFFKTKHTQQVSSTATNKALITSTTTPEPTPTTQPKSIITKQIYTVQAGDDLWHIAEKFYKSGYNWVDIARANNLENPGILFSGNKLLIPVITPAQQTLMPQITPAPQTGIAMQQNHQDDTAIKTNLYSVQQGDDLWTIAVRAYGDGYRWTDIAKANNLVNPSLIHSGNIFKIPR